VASAPSLTVPLPPGVDAAEARNALREAIREAVRKAVQDSAQDAAKVAGEAPPGDADSVSAPRRARTRQVHLGEFLPGAALAWILASAILKITYKGRMQAEAKAAAAAESAEAESLKRQVVEARMAAMQAQVEPHFLFNTLASIDHLIETDPARASRMQKNLIALLRATMPTLRETGAGNGSGARDLGRELAVIRPYLEILEVRMEERLRTSIEVPDGLLSAEFPPMMLQTLVENAVKHGLEPKAEGGTLSIRAEVAHGRLVVSVADTGLGFGQSPTTGTGVGLANIRERLQLLYGSRAALTVAENRPAGTVATITVPYRSLEGSA
jgi:LytS/YehU family sensor histidine kinase